MSEQDRLIREAALEEKRMVKEAKALWLQLRGDLAKKRGPGYLRYTEKTGLSNPFKAVVPRIRLAGGEWRDIVHGIEVTAQNPEHSPWRIFDAALEAMARREDIARQADKDRERTEGPRPTRGLRPLGESVGALVDSLQTSGGSRG